MFYAKFQPNIPSGSGVEADFVIFAFFRNSGLLGYSTLIFNFTILRHWNQVKLYVKFENFRYSEFIKEDV